MGNAVKQWQFDLSGYLIWTLEHLGLAREVYRIPSALRARRKGKDGVSRTKMPSIRDKVPMPNTR